MGDKKKFAVILSGCGNKDGAEIHESVMTLWAIHKHGAEYQCFAPDIPQHHVLNFINDQERAGLGRQKIYHPLPLKGQTVL
jgi:enhancing lycopene biosynthesis protein 2